ncbi:hypothetical protein LXL04_024074 [Taraxacum kok-saghyz]
MLFLSPASSFTELVHSLAQNHTQAAAFFSDDSRLRRQASRLRLPYLRQSRTPQQQSSSPRLVRQATASSSPAPASSKVCATASSFFKSDALLFEKPIRRMPPFAITPKSSGYFSALTQEIDKKLHRAIASATQRRDLLQALFADIALEVDDRARGFVETRQQLLTLKPNHRMNWIGFAVSHHLNSNASKAIDILEAYEGTLEDDYPPESERCEHGEMLLYKISLLEECGLLEKALKELRKREFKIVNKLDALYKSLAEQYTWSSAVKRIPLDFLDGMPYNQKHVKGPKWLMFSAASAALHLEVMITSYMGTTTECLLCYFEVEQALPIVKPIGDNKLIMLILHLSEMVLVHNHCYRLYYGSVTTEFVTESLLRILQRKDSYGFYNGSVPTDFATEYISYGIKSVAALQRK